MDKIENKMENKTNKNIPQNAPNELFDNENEYINENKGDKYANATQEDFMNYIKLFYEQNPYTKINNIVHELEVRFGTKGIKILTQNDYDNVIKTLKSFGFITSNNFGEYYLRINNEFLDLNGKLKLSNIRTEIIGLNNIQEYCKTDDIKHIYNKYPTSVQFIQKKNAILNGKRIYPINYNDYNFRVSYQQEIEVKMGTKNYILHNWSDSKKEFRYLNRVKLIHNDYPVLVDISIVKYGDRLQDKYGRQQKGPMKRVYSIKDSNVFSNVESYEIEIEIDNHKIGPGTVFNTPQLILIALRKVIKFILSGLQETKYPISYPEQEEILKSYIKLIWKDDFDLKKRITSNYFIGPNSITLQLTNIAEINSERDNNNQPNIRKNFVVTDKADGIRHLMYISNKGKIYLINTNMDIKFTGAITLNDDIFDSLIDGELILLDKNGIYLNCFASFDLYYIKGNDVRYLPFISTSININVNINDQKNKLNKTINTRYSLLKNLIKNLNAISVVSIPISNENIKKTISSLKKEDIIISPIKIIIKQFLPLSNEIEIETEKETQLNLNDISSTTIFDACAKILNKEKEGLFEYNTDGLIFTHSFYGVGSNEIGKSGPKTKITWENSFKWKPPDFNTIDFLITTIKDVNGVDLINPLFEEGINTENLSQITEYKTIELRCGFSEKRDGFINPCQNIIDDILPEIKSRFEEENNNSNEDYLPKRFYPTEPYDVNAGLCKIILKTDDSGNKQMLSEENEVFKDNTIVEFSYDLSKEEGWRWIPLRVRHDKTAKLNRGEKEYGNSYKVCNENWKSIHPSGRITDLMLSTGEGIPDILVSEDTYYNTTSSGKFKTEAMKNFHNLYVKKLLITHISKKGDILIDYACGKAGDLPKWISAKLSFVFGIDYSKDNLENRLDGACARFLKAKQTNKTMPYALFVHGNSAFNIRNGSALLNDKARMITNAVFGKGSKNVEELGKGVARQYGKGENGFNISSCQFAIHYFFENPETLNGFIKNVTECTKLNGYFIGTSYDGKMLFNELRQTQENEKIQIMIDNKKIWEITKKYSNNEFLDDSSCLGYKIDVYQESINQVISEYLVNYNYLDRIMDSYGFKLLDKNEANEIGLPNGSGLFSELFDNMLEELNKNKYNNSNSSIKNYGLSPYMKEFEKKISFLNRYFVYKKIREININKVEIEIGEYDEMIKDKDIKETTEVIKILKSNKEKPQLKAKIIKLKKKIILVPATNEDENV